MLKNQESNAVSPSTLPLCLSSLFDQVEALFTQAELALSKEQFELAEYFFQAAHSKNPQNPVLLIQEAQSWHRYGALLSNPTYFTKSYRLYKHCFSLPDLAYQATLAAIYLKIEEYELTAHIGAIYDALRLLNRLKEPQDLLKAKAIYYKGIYEQDVALIQEALSLIHTQPTITKNPSNTLFIAKIYKSLFDLTQDQSYLVYLLNYECESLDLNPHHVELRLHLACDYKLVYSLTFNETYIDKFHALCHQGSLIHPHYSELYFVWAEGLIAMGIAQDKVDWVKLGLEKTHEGLTQTSQTSKIDLIRARGLCYLGQKLDKLGHIQEAFDKIKDFDEDPSDDQLVITYVEILVCYGRYFNDIDYHYQAIEKLQEALSFDKTKREHWKKMAALYLEVSHHDNQSQTVQLSLKMIDQALKFYKCPETLLIKASALSRLGEFKHNQGYFEEALLYFETAFNFPLKLFQIRLCDRFDYAKTLDLCAGFQENEKLYLLALEELTTILLIDPTYPHLHHQIALTKLHLGEMTLNSEPIKESLIHFKLALQTPDSDSIYVDWAIAYLTLSEMADTPQEVLFLQTQAGNKLKKALKKEQLQAYYFMACLCSICRNLDQAMIFLKLCEKHEILPPPEDLLHDEWLHPLSDHVEFIKLVERQEMKRL